MTLSHYYLIPRYLFHRGCSLLWEYVICPWNLWGYHFTPTLIGSNFHLSHHQREPGWYLSHQQPFTWIRQLWWYLHHPSLQDYDWTTDHPRPQRRVPSWIPWYFQGRWPSLEIIWFLTARSLHLITLLEYRHQLQTQNFKQLWQLTFQNSPDMFLHNENTSLSFEPFSYSFHLNVHF